MATGTIKNQPSIKTVRNVSIAFSNGSGTYTDADITAASVVFATRRNGSYSPYGITGVQHSIGKAVFATNYDQAITFSVDILIVS